MPIGVSRRSRIKRSDDDIYVVPGEKRVPLTAAGRRRRWQPPLARDGGRLLAKPKSIAGRAGSSDITFVGAERFDANPAPAPFLRRGAPDVSLYRSGRPLRGTVPEANEASLAVSSGALQ